MTQAPTEPLPTLPRHTGDDPPCPKCADAAVKAVRYTPATDAMIEHLRRVCMRCSWEWAEATVDAVIDPATGRTRPGRTDQDDLRA